MDNETRLNTVENHARETLTMNVEVLANSLRDLGQTIQSVKEEIISLKTKQESSQSVFYDRFASLERSVELVSEQNREITQIVSRVEYLEASHKDVATLFKEVFKWVVIAGIAGATGWTIS